MMFDYPFSSESTTLTDEQIVNARLATMREFCQSAPNYVYVFDNNKKKLLFASDSVYILLGLSPEDVERPENNIYSALTKEEDRVKLTELRKSVEKLHYEKSVKGRKHGCLEFNLCLTFRGKEKLFHFCAVPFMYNNDNSVRMILGFLSPSSKKDKGEAIFRIKGERKFYLYDFGGHKWIEKSIVELNDRERLVLTLSAQGFTEREIASVMCRSHNSIKTYKRSLFRKLGVTSIAEALMYSLNNHLL